MKLTKISLIVLLVITAVFGLNSCSEDKKDEPTPTTVTDIDGNVYHAVKIGTQIWMVENLKVTKYNDGTIIPTVTEGTAWQALTTGAWCNYNNDAANGAKYGKLYNWYAVNTGKLAPAGWHVPTDAEWTTLNNYVSANLGTSGSVGKALAATTDWSTSTGVGEIGNDLTKNNSTGFSALPAGSRYIDGYFNINYVCNWWSSTQYDYDIGNALRRNMGSDNSVLSSWYYNKEGGLSVRCIKD